MGTPRLYLHHVSGRCVNLEATNNGSERALRPSAVYRKITSGFRSEWGAKLYADIRSVVETARRRSIRAIAAVRPTPSKTGDVP
jgi:hypothetical protein